MDETRKTFALQVQQTTARCPVGEQVGNQNLTAGKIPVLSCEGACIRGEIAELQPTWSRRRNPTAARATESCSPYPIRRWQHGSDRRQR